VLEVIMAVTLSGVGGIAVLGALHTLTVTSSAASQRAQGAVALLSAQALLSSGCSSAAVAHLGVTVVDPCPDTGRALVGVSIGSGRGHRHLSVVVDGGP
jgi:hypothetical protein